MLANNPRRRPHVIIHSAARTERYTNPSTEHTKIRLPPRKRKEHGEGLKKQLETAIREAQSRLRRVPEEKQALTGVYLQFESEEGFELKAESLSDRLHGIELVAVSQPDPKRTKDGEEIRGKMTATVLVPEGKQGVLFEKLDEYLTKTTPSGKPLHKTLIESISKIEYGTARGLWTDSGKFPSEGEVIWWEAWLRTGGSEQERQRILRLFRAAAAEAGLEVSSNEIIFPESTVILLHANAKQIDRVFIPLKVLAELRRVRKTADFFTGMKSVDQAAMARDAISRILPPRDNAPTVCVLDTGIISHPLLAPALDEATNSAYDHSWGSEDHHGHGTEMARLCLFGDLIEFLDSKEKQRLTHWIESVKILPPVGQNPPPLYGDITRECVARAEVATPGRNRAFCMAVTTDASDRGKPSSWSAAVDQICSGALEEEGTKRLVLVSAGNTVLNTGSDYPARNFTEGIQDPAHAWNAVTVGAFTEKDSIDPDKFPGLLPLAPKGGLSPCSTTSMPWQVQWPHKPDAVFEGGNSAISPSDNSLQYVESLRLLSTGAFPRNPFFVATGDTSGATAQAAHMCARIFASYPSFWPETVRALLVHSARWTPVMTGERELEEMTENEKKVLLRTYGYGVPDLNRALWSARNSLTMIVQNALHPYTKEGSRIVTNDMHLRELPWPHDALASLPGETLVEMRTTLSYFIEPKPERKGFNSKFRYMSHGLRFAMKTSLESVEEFRKRINREARDEDEKQRGILAGDAKWFLGKKLRSRGSIHSDIWRGSAAELAEKGAIAVYPVAGWWKDLQHMGRYGSEARYSLIITITTPDIGVDIYTPVASLILV
jgi:hypothetical protein